MLLQFCKNLLLRIQLTYNTFNNANRWPFLLLLGVGVPRRGEVVGELIFLFLPVSPLFPCFFLFLVPAIPILPLSRLRLRAHVTRTYIYNVSPSTPFHTSFQIYVLQHPYQSASYKIVSEIW